MYVSSDGTKRDVANMNYEYLVNALSKCYREIFNSKNTSEYNKFVSNISVLTGEIQKRLDKFVIDKLDDKEWK